MMKTRNLKDSVGFPGISSFNSQPTKTKAPPEKQAGLLFLIKTWQ